MMSPQEMSKLVHEWELEEGESFYEYSGLLDNAEQVLALAEILDAKDLLEDEALWDIKSETFPEIITLVSWSRAFNSGVHEDYMILLDNINAFILKQGQEEFEKFKLHFVTGHFHKAFQKEEIKYD